MLIHKWLGLALSLWLLLVTITGTILLYKNDLLVLTYPQLEQSKQATQQEAIDIIQSGLMSPDSRYVFVPTDLHPWVEAIEVSGDRAYYSTEGELLVQRLKYGDWISWFVEFHHHLLLDGVGEELQGIFGLLTILILITGLIKWWPKGKWQKRDLGITFSRPGKKRWGQTLWQSHRTLGVVLLIPIVILVFTGTAMIYSQAFNSGLNSVFPQHHRQPVDYAPIIEKQNQVAQNLPSDWTTRLQQVSTVLPDLRPVMIYVNSDKLRMKQPEEWHPNGRSYVSFHPNTSQISEITNYRDQTLGTKISQTFYALHIAEVGGLMYFSIAVISGIALVWITVSGFWFWLWCRAKQKLAKQKRRLKKIEK